MIELFVTFTDPASRERLETLRFWRKDTKHPSKELFLASHEKAMQIARQKGDAKGYQSSYDTEDILNALANDGWNSSHVSVLEVEG